MSDRKIAFWFIALLSVLVLVPFLGETIFYSKGEPREAIVAYTMLESGNWILPTNYGVEIAYKPPFLYWTIAVISSVLGGVTEFSARMPSALAFLAMQLVFFSFVAKRKDVKTAFLTSILLLSSFEVHRAAVACRLDMLQVSLIVISLCLLFRWDEKNCKGIPWLAVLLMACATLTKGPVGSIFPCLGIGVYQLLRGRSFGKTFFSLLGIGLLSLIPLGIWFWAAYQQGGEAFVNLMLEENTGRFFRKMSYASHENPLWYNFLTIIWGWVPWTLVLLISLFGLKWKKIRLLPEGASVGERLKKAWCKFRSQSPLQLFAWVVILTIFIFYCIPKSKRSVYLLPIYPFMGMLLAEYLLALVQRGAKVFRISAWIFVALTILLTVTFFAVRLDMIPESIWGTGKHAAENIAFVNALHTVQLSLPKWLIVFLPLVAAGCLLYMLVKRADTRSLLYGTAGCILCIFVSLDGVYQPTILAVKSDRHLAVRLNELEPQGMVYSYADWVKFYGINYYLGDRVRIFDKLNPAQGYVLVTDELQEQFLQDTEDTYRVEGTGKHAAENIAFVNALHTVQLSLPKWLIVFLPLVAAGCLLYMLVKRADTRSLLYGTAGCILCIFVSLDGVYQPTILAVKSDRHLAVRLNELEPQGMVYSYADWVKFYGINYYLGDRVRIFDKLNPAQGYVLVTDELQEQFLQDTEDTYRVEEVYRTPLRSCDLRRKVIVYKFSKK